MITSLAAIKQRLAAATPGEWRQGYRDGRSMETITSCKRSYKIARVVWGCGCCESGADEQDLANAAFIAHCPTDIDFLIGELERLQCYVCIGPLAECRRCEDCGYVGNDVPHLRMAK